MQNKTEQNGGAVKKRTLKPATLKTVQIGILASIMLIMHETGLCLIPVGPFSLTTMLIPVVIAGITTGPVGGAVLGAMFGADCLLAKEAGAFLDADPVASVVLMVVIRGIALGAFSGVLFKLFGKIDRKKIWSFGATGLLTAFLNTALFIVGAVILFGEHYQLFSVPMGTSRGVIISGLIAAVAVQAVIEILLCCIIAGAAAKAITVFLNKTWGAEQI